MTKPLLAAMLALIPGCVAADTDDTADLGETSQAISGLNVWNWSTPGNAGPDLDLGPTSTQTCFLTGVQGTLSGNATAGVFENNGHWWAKTRAGTGPGVSVDAACIPFTANRVVFGTGSQNNNPAGIGLVPEITPRQCFITSISSQTNFWAAPLQSPPSESPSIDLRHDQFDWLIVPGIDIQNLESGGGVGHCVDVPSTNSVDFTVTAASNNTVSAVLAANDGTVMDWNHGWACGLRKIEGVFHEGPTTAGARLFLNANNKWQVQVADDLGTGHRELAIHCFK